jgi:hypothetical protein
MPLGAGYRPHTYRLRLIVGRIDNHFRHVNHKHTRAHGVLPEHDNVSPETGRWSLFLSDGSYDREGLPKLPVGLRG